MSSHAKSLAICGSLLCAGAALAAEPSGQYESLLLQTLMANADGECPSMIMADNLRKSCASQILDVRHELAKLGRITKVSYLGVKDTQAGGAEGYAVFFEHGEWDWAVNIQRDGRLQFANASNPPRYDIGSFSLNNH